MKKILTCILAVALITACEKTEQPVESSRHMATTSSFEEAGKSSRAITTTAATTITSFTATSGGHVPGGGGSHATERGVVYHTSPNPTTSNFKIQSDSGSGDFTSILSGLTGNTTYYVRAYEAKRSGTRYGNEVSFTTLPDYGTFTDGDGNVYRTIAIGTQVWMMENLKTTTYRDGSSIPNVTDSMAWTALSSGAYCNYRNDTAYAATYGRLYNWFAATDARNIAPAGWHMPTVDEWNTLINFLGGDNVAGGKAKETGFAHWLVPNEGATNSSGFTALPGGGRVFAQAFNGFPERSFFKDIGYYANWWTATAATGPYPNALLYKAVDIYTTNFYRSSFSGPYSYNDKRNGYSLRLIKD